MRMNEDFFNIYFTEMSFLKRRGETMIQDLLLADGIISQKNVYGYTPAICFLNILISEGPNCMLL